MVLPTSGALSLGQIATEYGDSQPNSMSEFYRGGSLVPTTVSGTATQAAPSTNGTYTDFGSVTGLTLVRASGSSEVSGNFYQGGTFGNANSSSGRAGARGREDNGTITITPPGNSATYGTGGTIPSNQVYGSGNGPWTVTTSTQADVGYFYINNFTNYTFTNNTGFNVTIEGTTIANGASSNISPSGDYNISFTVNSNPNVPTSGTVDFNDFYGGRAS